MRKKTGKLQKYIFLDDWEKNKTSEIRSNKKTRGWEKKLKKNSNHANFVFFNILNHYFFLAYVFFKFVFVIKIILAFHWPFKILTIGKINSMKK